jgi:hypothetical protein
MKIRRCRKEYVYPKNHSVGMKLAMPFVVGKYYRVSAVKQWGEGMYSIQHADILPEDIEMGISSTVVSIFNIDEYFETVQETRKRKIESFI